jgi:isocitrate dehydrogenase kinase/phosphatase
MPYDHQQMSSPQQLSSSENIHHGRLARNASMAILDAFVDYHNRYKSIARRAKKRFEERDWAGVQADSLLRLDLYASVLTPLLAQIREMLGGELENKLIWMEMKQIFTRLIILRNDLELAETWFNSVTRRLFITVGVDPRIEFIWFDAEYLSTGDETPVYRRYAKTQTSYALIDTILADYAFDVPYVHREQDIRHIADTMIHHLTDKWGSPDYSAIEMVKSVFFRGKAAYLVGRIRWGNRIMPIALPLINTDEGIVVDAVLLTENDASTIFSFTRSYFQVVAEKPSDLVGFLKTLMPLKPVAELYISLGYNKHGKTLLYRDLYRHLKNSTDKFEIARGTKGMVMICFTLPSYDRVFKIIKDRFDPPKTATRQEVKDRYKMVFRHDRAGRLVDAQEFEYLTFSRDRFSPELIEELQTYAADTVTINEREVIIAHIYTERRLYPLDLFIKEMHMDRSVEAIVEYGNAIRELAAANIFPGDLLIKNFGVTRHGRVVFYDYDELCGLDECNFRIIPEPRNEYEEMSATPWYTVRPGDVFPEEFRTFLWFPKPLRAVMDRVHGDLYTADFWLRMQSLNAAGEVVDIYPYRQEERFERRFAEKEL